MVCKKIDGYPIIYIGISQTQGLRRRIYNNHFNGTARNSTLRKSLGSLNGWRKYRIYDNGGKYKFDEMHEQELTGCMYDNLIIFYWIDLSADIGDLETELINELNPPLNIVKNKSSINKRFRKKLKKWLRSKSETKIHDDR